MKYDVELYIEDGWLVLDYRDNGRNEAWKKTFIAPIKTKTTQFGFVVEITDELYSNFVMRPLPHKVLDKYEFETIAMRKKFREFLETVNTWITGTWTVTGIYLDFDNGRDAGIEFAFSEPEDAIMFQFKFAERLTTI